MGIAPEMILDFSVCTNPFMPPPRIKEMQLGDVAIEQYPDSLATELRQHLSVRLKVSPDNIMVGSGTTELIRLVALAYFRQGDSVLILEPTYGDYGVASQIAGVKLIKQQMKAIDGFALCLEETAGLIRQNHPRAVFLCNPNNPTGRYLAQAEIEIVLDSIGDSLLVLDEAYLSFVEQSWPSTGLISRGNVVILRSMTKDYGLAGLRLGYAVACREIIDNLRRVCPPWNVNAVAQKVGILVLDDDEYLKHTRHKIKEARQYLVNGLVQLGFQPLPSDTNYFLIKVGDARSFRTGLLKHGIQVRDCNSFGLPEYVRIAPRTIAECQKLIDSIKMMKKRGELDAGI